MKLDIIASLVSVWGKVYLRFTDPKRKIMVLKRKLKANHAAQKKLFTLASSPSNRRRFAQLMLNAVKLRKAIEELENAD